MPFFREIVSMLESEFGISMASSATEAVLLANEGILPRVGRALPSRVALPHDVAGYFAEMRRVPNLASLTAEFRPLGSRGAGDLDLHDQPPCTSYAFADLELTFGTLELASNLRI
jgi:hypothetical protein